MSRLAHPVGILLSGEDLQRRVRLGRGISYGFLHKTQFPSPGHGERYRLEPARLGNRYSA